MKILYDSQVFQFQTYGGISRYFVNLAQRVAREEQVVVAASWYINNYLAELPPGLVKGVKVAGRPSRGGRIFDWVAKTHEKIVMARANPDILHETYYAYQSKAKSTVPTVLTVFDMIHERFKSSFPQDDETIQQKKAAVFRASHVICISENTRRDLLALYELDPSKVSVVYLGHDLQSASRCSEVDTLVINQLQPYLFYVGHRGNYKNFNGFLRAYASSSWLRENFQIICFGGGSFQPDEMDLIKELSIKPHQIKQVSGGDEALVAYYQSAAALVYPSLYEGFGIPPLEAMGLGCPVICSNTSSIPEVVGDAGEYFDPEQIDSIRTALETVLQSSERRADLVAKGFKKCSEYSWDRCANETLVIYRGLVN